MERSFHELYGRGGWTGFAGRGASEESTCSLVTSIGVALGDEMRRPASWVPQRSMR